MSPDQWAPQLVSAHFTAFPPVLKGESFLLRERGLKAERCFSPPLYRSDTSIQSVPPLDSLTSHPPAPYWADACAPNPAAPLLKAI